MQTILEATLLIKVREIHDVDAQLETADEILQQIDALLESIYCKGGQYHRDGFIVEFQGC